MYEPRVYSSAERPLVEVEIEGSWYPGELRMWRRLDDGTWVGNVQYSLVVAENRLDTFPEQRIRELPDVRTRAAEGP
jgi:hypothetical protein